MSDQFDEEYKLLITTGGFVELSDRCFVRLTGEDRKAFLHNFCTNEIKQLDSGHACEAFVLNTKGKILGFVHVLAGEQDLLLTGHGNQASTLIEHLDKYLIREDVELKDATGEFGSIFVAGELAAEKLKGRMELPGQNEICATMFGETKVSVSNIEVAGFGYMLAFSRESLEAIESQLGDSGLVKCSADALNILRVQQQTSWFGIDATDANLPQELARDEKAINFNKGCYLGQETVARIDARGRVNQLMVGLKFQGETPNAGDEILVDGKSGAKITSVATSGELGVIGMGFVRRALSEAGTQIGDAVVVDRVL